MAEVSKRICRGDDARATQMSKVVRLVMVELQATTQRAFQVGYSQASDWAPCKRISSSEQICQRPSLPGRVRRFPEIGLPENVNPERDIDRACAGVGVVWIRKERRGGGGGGSGDMESTRSPGRLAILAVHALSDSHAAI
ncbi:uncharacterized protein TRUGW13939_03691 [Talaromyces rugulosus]|uniref:Uncharacterized protein n=1 Tax=Talaromyces rugulosus TaxID=121627 RepID=A0A7H8QRW8_TALRU|nr:uncharacterized protein TRUGW13939_03691 [Talaromyces rugulosus]QKX56586.1 hypothetical protein TRUGW13939_03691 [Talaromyces rugulosus]